MHDQGDEFEGRLAAIESHLAELGGVLAESMVLQAEFMTWAARFAQGGLPTANPGQAIDFSQRMLTEARSLIDAHVDFARLLKSRSGKGEKA